MTENRARREAKRGWYALLLLQFVLALCVPYYNKVEPTLAGMPFFYWYQLLMVLVGAVLTAVVYVATERQS
jgi:Protein of unknown function (DUF3311)